MTLVHQCDTKRGSKKILVIVRRWLQATSKLFHTSDKVFILTIFGSVLSLSAILASVDLKSRSRVLRSLMNGSSDVIAKMKFNFITRIAIKIADIFLSYAAKYTRIWALSTLLRKGSCGYGMVLDKYRDRPDSLVRTKYSIS